MLLLLVSVVVNVAVVAVVFDGFIVAVAFAAAVVVVDVIVFVFTDVAVLAVVVSRCCGCFAVPYNIRLVVAAADCVIDCLGV